MKKNIGLFCCFISLLFAKEDPFELLASSPDEMISLFSDESSLVGGLVSPLSGQLCLRSNDLCVKGANDLVISRVFIPPSLSQDRGAGEFEQFIKEREFFSS